MEQSLHDSLDGSHTVFSNKYNAHYHSIYGALDESIHVFISAGFFYFYRRNRTPISILEMGFGTGLNAYLSLLESDRFKVDINYVTLEADPISPELARTLNYPTLLQCAHAQGFYRMHDCAWEKPILITNEFNFQKRKCLIQDFSSDQKFDLIYFDAFAPSCQSHLWELELHQKLYLMLTAGGALVTYCTQGQFKRNLKSIGYRLEILNGPGKKREMLRAIKA